MEVSYFYCGGNPSGITLLGGNPSGGNPSGSIFFGLFNPLFHFQLDNYIIVDVGANLTNKKFGRDLDSVIQRAKDAGISKIMVTGTSVQGSKDALRLSRLYPGTLYATAGKEIHKASMRTALPKDCLMTA